MIRQLCIGVAFLGMLAPCYGQTTFRSKRMGVTLTLPSGWKPFIDEGLQKFHAPSLYGHGNAEIAVHTEKTKNFDAFAAKRFRELDGFFLAKELKSGVTKKPYRGKWKYYLLKERSGNFNRVQLQLFYGHGRAVSFIIGMDEGVLADSMKDIISIIRSLKIS